MRTTPAITGTNVRTIGTNRAISTAWPTAPREEAFGPRHVAPLREPPLAGEEPRPCAAADRVTDLVSEDRGEHAADDDQCEVELALGGEQPGGEQQ